MSSEGSSSSIPKSPSSKTEYIHDIFVTNDFKFEYPWITFLKASLMNAGINTLVDSGQNISPTLLSSIQRSRIVVLVFTPEFRYYRDCVEKLEKIMECHENKVSLVLPIFFDVSPHEVREWWIREIAQGLETPISTRSLFLSVDGVSQNNIGRWRRLLLKVTRRRGRDDVNFSKCIRTVGFLEAEDQSAGWTVSSEDCDSSSESGKQIIREITNFIKRELEVSHLVLPPHLVGIQLRVKGVLNLFNYYSKDFGLMEDNVIMVGIWGIGGIGKTTLSRAIYDTIKGSFERRSFLENIKNVWAKDNGPTCLQEQLISNISLTNSDKIHDIELGIRRIRTVLHNKRALIVLDNVSQMDQLMAFCGSGEGFGPGSMIIIATRNKHLLDDLKVKYVYEMKRMDQSESLEVFSWRAFKQSSPTNDLVKLANRVFNCCEGLPLVLKVMGSFLSNRKIAEWQRVLKKLKSVPTGEIQEKLKISYEYLDDLVKDIFFNIACCYVGEEKEYVTEKLSGFQLPAETGISMLIERSLVEIKENNKLHMHDLLQEIVKGSIPNKPKPKYIYDVFLSFRGEDSRRSFTAHLYDALKKAGIEVFMDNEIQRGKNISSSLIQAIESSRLSVIIFSSNYGGSRWCLQELEKIMECHRTNVQEVLPIFYDVQPSDVRKQAGTFGKAMERLMMRISVGKDKELSWTRALNEAANLSGWDSHNYRNDVELIDHVVETISIKLDDSKCFLVANHPVGVKSRMQEIIKLLSGKSNEIILVGIFGMGGIGKTTIAKAIYNEIGQNFEVKVSLTILGKYGSKIMVRFVCKNIFFQAS